MKKIIFSITFLVMGASIFAQTTEAKKQEKLDQINAVIQPILEREFKKHSEKTITELKMNTVQANKFREIEGRRMKDVQGVMSDAVTGKKITEKQKEDLVVKEKKYDKEVEKILTPEQNKKYLTIREEERKKAKSSASKYKKK